MICEVRMPGPPNPTGWVAFVQLAAGQEVRVRCRYRFGGDLWFCEACGRQTRPMCEHAAAAQDHVDHERTRR